MLYNLLYPLSDHWSFLNLFQYITFRTIMAVLTALAISFVFGPMVIRKLARFQQPIREDGPQRHVLEKQGTPTMGGALILLAVVTATGLWADMTNPYVLLTLFATLGFGAVGFWDDAVKLVKKNPKGVPGRTRFLIQTAIVLIMAGLLQYVVNPGVFGQLAFPLFKNLLVDLGWLFLPFAVLVVVGCGNAVNLTDGLDGLAIGPSMITAASFLIIAYATGHIGFASYLGIPYIPGSGELAVFCGAMVGAALGFLWFNTYPAQVFMGDVGALALGAALGSVALMTQHEIVLMIIGGVFVMETLSVVAQVTSFKLFGKRVFRMAPIHHHFELKGWAEPKIIVRFWIISIILALIGLATLKVR
ncbi:phospho-N-acetylmuramoyl-pentapeptide-transferase [Magnetofaba australis]|uniref:Phospho-N-acetylmuramoyl-pentapeptide-transferase n=1 Tax=Magnetofaba australis IT-1 TaxID=1434232 RepID=A0A1Y2K8L4_9PROT|nr:phospho-N-acetylmuramoyl-pentapeptide-transferase [Magnetofaba australis]OSM07063.1 putative phospho-N-acetylmuramoyl-pentapeptide-transferase [Magnetofaba australis IT-1]